MYELISNILLIVLIVISIVSLAIAAMIGYSRYWLNSLKIKERKLNQRVIDRWFYASVIAFGSILFIAKLGDFVQFFIGRFAENDSPLWAIVITYVVVILIAAMYGCLLVLADDLSSRLRFYILEREICSKINEEIEKAADISVKELEKVLRL